MSSPSRSPEKVAAYNKKRLDAQREWMDELKSRPCDACGGIFPPVCMDWHHIDRTTKKFAVSKQIRGARATILAEVAKCLLLCANCHRLTP